MASIPGSHDARMLRAPAGQGIHRTGYRQARPDAARVRGPEHSAGCHAGDQQRSGSVGRLGPRGKGGCCFAPAPPGRISGQNLRAEPPGQPGGAAIQPGHGWAGHAPPRPSAGDARRRWRPGRYRRPAPVRSRIPRTTRRDRRHSQPPPPAKPCRTASPTGPPASDRSARHCRGSRPAAPTAGQASAVPRRLHPWCPPRPQRQDRERHSRPTAPRRA